MKRELAKYADDIVQDRLGSVFGVRRGAEDAPTVMVAGHMDEVGFMVTQITDNGMLRFQTLGGWWSQVLLAQRVEVQTDNGPIIGVISSIPPHILTDAQRAKPMEIKNMMIDIGADDRETRSKWGSDRDSRSCRSARSPRWPTRRKYCPKRGITATAAG